MSHDGYRINTLIDTYNIISNGIHDLATDILESLRESDDEQEEAQPKEERE